jgi:FKBP-type peptidyl-prolyl cis-trans isomerase 2
MIPRPLLIAALSALVLSGCTGPGLGAHAGDSVSIVYTYVDANTGAVLRADQRLTFVYGSSSGLGAAVDEALEGLGVNGSITLTLPAYGERVEVSRFLPAIPTHQSAPRAEFEQFVVRNPPVGHVFPAYGIYNGIVTSVGNTTIEFDVVAEPGQRNTVASVGAVLVTTPVDGELHRVLEPTVGATFTVSPPNPLQPSTPLGLTPGAYRTEGATETSIVYGRSPSTQPDLVGKDLHITVRILAITPATQPFPTSGNYGVRQSPQVHGDPAEILGGSLPSGSPGGHQH